MTRVRVFPTSGSPLSRFLRAMALMAVVGGVVWAFEARFSLLADRLAGEQAIFDATGTLSPEERRFLAQAADEVKSRFGLSLRVRVARTEPTLPALDEKTLAIGLGVADGTVRLVVPSLVERALGPEFARVMQGDILAPSLAAGTWPQGLVAAVVFLQRQLSDPPRREEDS